ncbi:MAG: hypothetical protein ABR583_07205 [Gaiellaceae bacterium]
MIAEMGTSRGGPAVGVVGIGAALVSFAMPILGVPRLVAWLVLGSGCALVITGALWWYGSHRQAQIQVTPPLHTAALFLRTELLDIRHKVQLFGTDRTIPDGFAFPAYEWDKYREMLARSPTLYEAVERAYTEAHRVNQIFQWRRTVSESRLVGVSQSDGLAKVDAAAREAVTALDHVLGDSTEDAARRIRGSLTLIRGELQQSRTLVQGNVLPRRNTLVSLESCRATVNARAMG